MKTELSFLEITRTLDAVVLPQCDLVVGIATGGTVPAALVAERLGVEMRVLHINYRDEENQPQRPDPEVLSGLRIPAGTRRILIVDDVSVSGATLDTARRLLSDFELQTLVMKGHGDVVLFPDVRTCVQWPWKPVEESADRS